jgi:hypothetical protein
VDGHREDQAEAVDEDVPLAAIDLLARVVALRPPFSVVLTDWLSMMAAEGDSLWEYTLPAGGCATPSTHQIRGRRYFVIVAGGAEKLRTNACDALEAFAIPN